MITPAVIQPKCAVCGHPSATIQIKVKRGRCIFAYYGPAGGNGDGHHVPDSQAATIIQAFSAPYASDNIRQAGLYDDAGFCHECGCFYCAEHWNLSTTGGGFCPQRHFKSLDPHWSPAEDDDD
jgi:hypothetical protein